MRKDRLPEMPRCWSWTLERRAGRATAIEAILEENLAADDILSVY
jgi:hypothetical protein